jgi:predicted PurR-regulated permease PerM
MPRKDAIRSRGLPPISPRAEPTPTATAPRARFSRARAGVDRDELSLTPPMPHAALTAKNSSAPKPDAIPAAEVAGEPLVPEAETLVRQGTLTLVFLGVLTLFAFVGTLIVARPVLVPMVAAALLAMTLMPAVNRLRQWGLPHALAATVIAVVLVAGLVALSYLLIEPLLKALDALPALDGFGQRLARLVRHVFGEPYTTWVADRIRETNPSAALSARLFSGAGETTVLVLTTIVLTVFLLLSGDLFLQKLVHVLPRIRDKMKAVKVVRAVQEDVGRYFATVTLINIVVGTIAGGIAWYWELPAPLLLAVLVALFNFVPYLGAIANVLLLLLASGAAHTAFAEVLAAPAAFSVVAALEGNFITPLIVGRRTQLNAVTVVFGLVFWFWVWGIAGMVLAIPLLLVVKGFATHIERLGAVNEFMGR